jgi:hypothetical protein
MTSLRCEVVVPTSVGMAGAPPLGQSLGYPA